MRAPRTRVQEAMLAEFGNRLKAKRIEKGWSQTLLAKTAKMSSGSYSHISAYKRGVREPGICTVVKLAEALEVSPAWLSYNIEGMAAFLESVPASLKPLIENLLKPDTEKAATISPGRTRLGHAPGTPSKDSNIQVKLIDSLRAALGDPTETTSKVSRWSVADDFDVIAQTDLVGEQWANLWLPWPKRFGLMPAFAQVFPPSEVRDGRHSHTFWNSLDYNNRVICLQIGTDEQLDSAITLIKSRVTELKGKKAVKGKKAKASA